MTIPAEDLRFEEALKIFETQVAEATQFWFAAAAMDGVAKLNPDTLKALNITPSFWVTVKVALEYQAILSVGKIYGPRRTNPHNIDSLFQVLSEGLAVFSKESLAARKRRMSSNADEWLPQLMKDVHVADIQDFKALRVLSKPQRKIYETQWEQIRNEHIAHTGVVDPNARWEMFQKTRISDLEQVLGFLNQLHKALWRMYYDGRRPTLEPATYSIESLVAKKIKDLSQSPNHEHIVAEARKCMFLITQAANALPPGYKRTGSWG